MRNREYFRGKKVTVVGLARSGLACARLLCELGAEVSVSDNKDNEATRSNAASLESARIKIELGSHSKGFIEGSDLIVFSPGVTQASLPALWSKERGIPVISEIEVGWIVCPATVIAVTGSAGKSSVASLIGRVLELAGKKVFVCGNIGNPFCANVAQMKPDDYVSLEVSSFQLETIRDFRPSIALILNFHCNHLDRHKEIKEYLNAKKRIFMNQKEDDFLILNSADSALKGLSRETKAKVIYFSKGGGLNPNQAAVAEVAQILVLDKDLCQEAFAEFKGLEHRLEYVAEIDKVKFINDSKATLVESTLWALENISSSVILIAGGRDKGLDYRGILKARRGKLREVVLMGEAKEKIARTIGGRLPLKKAATLREAVGLAFKDARAGDTVLFSPMCSSFDMFADYEDRGRAFKEAVGELRRQDKRWPAIRG